MSKIDGVVSEDPSKDIKITSEGRGKARKQVVVLQTTGELTKEQAITAMGKRSKRFVVVTVEQGKPEEAEDVKKGSDKKEKGKRGITEEAKE